MADDLAAALVHAAAEASWSGPPQWQNALLDTLGYRDRHTAHARAAVGAALRKLDEEGFVLANVRTGGQPIRLGLLADRVESEGSRG